MIFKNNDYYNKIIADDFDENVKKYSSLFTRLHSYYIAERYLDYKSRISESLDEKICSNSYITDYEDYICVDMMGKLFRPEYVTDHFRLLLKNNGLRHIRFHDLRHSCASLLLAKNVPMKTIQEWLDSN